MNKKELMELIDTEVSKVVTETPLMEPEIPQRQRPIYRPVLKTEDEIDSFVFYPGNKDKEKY